MKRSTAYVAAARTADNHWARKKGAVACRRDVVRQDVVGVRDEVDELHFDNRTQAHMRCACRRADDADFRDRRIDDTRLTELVEESVGNLERAAVSPDV